MRKIRLIHRWLGLAFGIVIGFSALTGFLLKHDDLLESLGRVRMTQRPSAPNNNLQRETVTMALGRVAGEIGGLRVNKYVLKAGEREDEPQSRSSRRRPQPRTESRSRNRPVARERGDHDDDESSKKWLKALHKGDFLEPFGEVIIDAGALALIALVLSGFYLWFNTRPRHARVQEHDVPPSPEGG